MNDRLLELARSGDLEALDGAWLEATEGGEPIDAFLKAIELLPEAARKDKAKPLLTLLIDSLNGSGRHDDLAQIRMALIDSGADLTAKTRHALVADLREAHSEAEVLEPFLEGSGLLGDVPLRQSMVNFRKLWGMRQGCAITHEGGWGVGVIGEVNIPRKELKVQFVDGHTVDMPFASALDVLQPLPADDFRTMRYTRLEELKTMAQETPGEVIKLVLRILGGRGNSAKIKEALIGDVIGPKEWTGWWKTARQAAAQHPYISVEGGSRPIFLLRDTAVSPEDEAVESIKNAEDLGEATLVARDFLANRPESDVVDRILHAVADRIHEDDVDDGHQIEAWLLLRREEHPRYDEGALKTALEVDDSTGFAEMLNNLPKADVRKNLFQTLAEIMPETWHDKVVESMGALGPEATDGAVDFLVQNKETDLLREVLEYFLGMPSRLPYGVFHIARRLIAGRLGEGDSPSIPEVVVSLLQLYESQANAAERGDKTARGICKKMDTVILDPRFGVIQELAKKGSRQQVEQAMAMTRASRHLPAIIQDLLRDIVYDRYPDLDKRKAIPFWELEFIYTTRDGYAKRQEELRILMEEKIPDNSRAIGVAAGHGDLSENAEWTAAMDEQRMLTQRASELEEELKNWRALEEQELPEGIVAPGYRVLFSSSGEESDIRILGPWDADVEGVISYKAPLAQGLLGCKEGDVVEVTLPSGVMEVTILKAQVDL